MNFLAPRPTFPTIKFPNTGDEVKGTLAFDPEYRQQYKYGTKTLDTWPDGKAKMQAKVVLNLPEGPHAVYIKQSSLLANRIRAAVKAAGAEELTKGGTLHIKRVNDIPPERAGMKPQHDFEAEYTAPSGTDEGPPF